MGVRSFVAGQIQEGVSTLVDTTFNAVETIGKHKQLDDQLKASLAKTEADRKNTDLVNRSNEFLNNLQYSTDFDAYGKEVEDQFGTFAAEISSDSTLGDLAKKDLLENTLPQLKSTVASKASIQATNGRMKMLEADIEDKGNLIIANDADLDSAVRDYSAFLVLNTPYTDSMIASKVKDFRYSAAPAKAAQDIQNAYSASYADTSFDFDAKAKEIAGSYGLDAKQSASYVKAVTTWRKQFDTNVDENFTQTNNEILTQVESAKTQGQVFDPESIDSLIPSVPRRHQLELYKTRNTAVANNDVLISQAIFKELDNGKVFSTEDWGVVEQIHDPTKRDKVYEQALVNEGNRIIHSGGTLVKARESIVKNTGPMSQKNRNDAVARLTKEYLDSQGDVDAVVKLMMETVGESSQAEPVMVGDVDIAPIVESALAEAPPIDSVRYGKEGEAYLEEHKQDVVRFLAGKPSFSLQMPKFSFDPNGGGETAAESPEAEIQETVPTQDTVKGERGPQKDKTPVDAEIQNAVAREIVSQQANAVQEQLWADRTEAGHAQLRLIGSRERKANEELEAVQAKAGGELVAGGSQSTTPIQKGMSQESLIGGMFQRIKSGEGSSITQEMLTWIKNDDTRQQISSMAGSTDTLVVDDPTVLAFVDGLRSDATVLPDTLKQVVSGFVSAGLLRAETGEPLSTHRKFVDLGNADVLKTSIKEIVGSIYKDRSGAGIERTYLTNELTDAAERAVTRDPSLLGENFGKLQIQLRSFAQNSTAKGFLKNLTGISKMVTEGDVDKLLGHFDDGDFVTFMKGVSDGDYDLLINWDKANSLYRLRNLSNDKMLDEFTKEFSPYSTYKELQEKGTSFDKLEVLANVNFVASSRIYEKALEGSFGVHPSDMKVTGRMWAYQDPQNHSAYYLPVDIDAKNRGTLGWGMFTGDDSALKNLIVFKSYVDPQLTYELSDLNRQVSDPIFQKRLATYDSVSKNAGDGNSYQSTRAQQLYPATRGIVDSRDAKREELDTLMADIQKYRMNLLGIASDSPRERL